MSHPDEGYNPTLFKQDLEIYKKALNSKDFRTCNIIGNRIMSNSHLFDEKYFGIMGFFLKQLANEALILRNVNDPDSLTDIANRTKEFIDDDVFPQISSPKIDLGKLWIAYNNTLIKARNSFLPKDERDSYQPNQMFTSLTFKKILKVLFSEKQHLYYPTNNLFKGILNEMNRISKTYGTTTDELFLISIVYMLDRIDEYVGTTIINLDEFKIRIEKEIMPYFNKFNEICNKEKIDENEINNLLWELIKILRTYFIKFLEMKRIPSTSQIQTQQEVKLPVKSKLVDELAKGLEDEISGK